MSAPTRHPDVWDVAIALVFIGVGVALAASLLFLFIGAPMVMIGVELLMPRRSRLERIRRRRITREPPSMWTPGWGWSLGSRHEGPASGLWQGREPNTRRSRPRDRP